MNKINKPLNCVIVLLSSLQTKYTTTTVLWGGEGGAALSRKH